MQIGELFIALGFEVEGGEKLDKTNFNLKKLATVAAQAAAIVNALNAAFVALVVTTAKNAVEMKNFANQTGLATDKLKQFQYAAAGQDVEAAELADSIRAIAKAQADIKLGEGNIAPWQLLGIDPRQDPFDVLKQLRERIRDLDPNLARTITSQMGISEGVFAMLRSANLEWDKLQRKFILTRDEQQSIVDMNKEWKEFFFLLVSVKDRFMAAFARPLAAAAVLLKGFISIFATFVDWLSKGSVAANIVKWALWAIVAVMGALGVVLAVVAAALGVATVAVTAFETAGAPLILILTAISLGVIAMVAILVGAILVFQDLWYAIFGGKSAYDELGKAQREFFSQFLGWHTTAFQVVKDTWGAIAGFISSTIESITSIMPKWMVAGLTGNWAPVIADRQAAAIPNVSGGAGNSSMRQENNFDIKINGSDNPLETGRAVADSVSTQISNASYQQALQAI